MLNYLNCIYLLSRFREEVGELLKGKEEEIIKFKETIDTLNKEIEEQRAVIM